MIGALLAGCSSTASSTPVAYSSPHEDGNTFACVTCHALEEPTDDGLRRPGHPIGDAAARPSYKNGQVPDLLTAVNSCRREWMAAPEFAPNDPRWIALSEFLRERAPASAPALTFERVEPPADLGGGDASRGRSLFNKTCVLCHGEDGVGTQRAPKITGQELEIEYVAERVRTSGDDESTVYPNLSGGRMPFWAADRLSDDELRDVVAYVHESDRGNGPDAGVGVGPDGGGGRECEATHASVGRVAELTTRFHGVQGTATITDDCTVTIEMFGFDGQGVDVRVYGAAGGNYETGFSMSEDLRREGGYANDVIIATLPEGRSLEDLDGISIWCVPVGASFGDGLFGTP